MRHLIINADDFGYSRSVNRGIAQAHEHGIVTSASLMVDRPATDEAAAYARHHSELDLGLHAELSHWRVSYLPRKGAMLSPARLRKRVAGEISRQLERFRALVGQDPSHLDSHQHRHLAAVPRPLFEETAAELGIPLRRVTSDIRFCGEFYGHDERGRPRRSAITAEALLALIEELEDGVTELCCHPGFVDDLHDWYRDERALEVLALCDPQVADAVRRLEIHLCGFADAASATETVAT
jgi:predicted glycoside hydrolase/deacetylase ChbG (UPF0249 family)